MNRTEELLIILAEECAEVAQEASKCIRFGIHNERQPKPPGCAPKTNGHFLACELGDLMAMIKLLIQEENLSEDTMLEFAELKLAKVEKFMKNKKGLSAPELAAAFSHRTLPPLPSIEKPHRRGKPRSNKR